MLIIILLNYSLDHDLLTKSFTHTVKQLHDWFESIGAVKAVIGKRGDLAGGLSYQGGGESGRVCRPQSHHILFLLY